MTMLSAVMMLRRVIPALRTREEEFAPIFAAGCS